MADQIEQIVDFSGIKEFIDAPVRTYSSGMVARLGFAIATHIQPEVLIIDEILSVGDAEFQQKSTARILNYHKNGSTILIVSHNAPSIKQLCDHAIWLEHGSIKMQGDANEVVDHYSAYLHS